MKKIVCLIFVFILSFVCYGCGFDANKDELTLYQTHAILLLSDKIENFYDDYNQCDYTEFKETSVFEYQTNEKTIVCAQAKTVRYLGYDTFTIFFSFRSNSIYYQNSDILYSIYTAENIEFEDSTCLELYNQYKNQTDGIKYLNVEKCNKVLQERLNENFSNGMEGYNDISGSNGNEIHFHDETKLEKDYEYVIENDEVSIVSYKGMDLYNIVIPTFIEGKKVTKIKSDAFNFNSFYIGDQLIESYEVSITLPQFLKVIETHAFFSEYYYYYRENNPIYIEYVYLPKTVEYVAYEAFSQDTLLLFEGNGLSYNYDKAYYNVKKEDLLFQDDMIYMKWYDDGAESEAILLDCLRSNKKAKLPLVVEIDGQVMPVTRIGDGAFYNCPNLENIELHNMLEDVNYNAFNYSGSLDEIKRFYPNLKFNSYKNGYYIASNLNPYFLFFAGEEYFILHDDTQYFNFNFNVGKYTFNIKNGIQYIPSEHNIYFLGYGFVNDFEFNNREILFDSATKIINLHDGYCDDFIRGHTYYIPSGVIYIYVSDSNAGNNKIVVSSGNDKYISLNYSLYGNYGTTLLVASEYSVCDVGDIKNVFVVPNGVKYVKPNSISSWSIETICISDTVVEIDKNALDYTMIKNIIIGKSLKYLGNLCSTYARLDNIEVDDENPYYKTSDNFLMSLNSEVIFSAFCDYDKDVLEIPKSVKIIVDGALGCLECKVVLAYENVVSIGNCDTFDLKILCKNENVNSSCKVVIGDFLVSSGAIYSYTNNYATFVYCFSEDDHFKMDDFILNNIPVTHVLYKAFYHCEHTKITLSSNLKEIGSNAFFACYELENLIIPDSVTSIGDSAFDSCENLKWIIIPSSVVSFGNCCFTNCKDTTVYLKMNSIPSTWSDRWNDGGAISDVKRPYYFQSDWHLSDDGPVLN